MKPMSYLVAAAGIAAALLVKPALADDKSLYLRLGGYDALAAVTDDFLGRLEKDNELGRFFQGVSKDSVMRIRQHVVDLLATDDLVLQIGDRVREGLRVVVVACG